MVQGAVEHSLLEALASIVESEGVRILRGKLFTREQAVRLDAVDMIVDASGFVRATHVGEGTVAPVLRGYHGGTGFINSDGAQGREPREECPGSLR